MDLVSIIVPCYNQGKYLPETLESVLHQSYKEWECVIVNDGSLDDTEQIAKKYCDVDKRFVYVYQKNAGLSAARNNGVANSHGKYILPLDSDDKIGENYLKLAIEAFHNNANLRLVYCRAAFFGKRHGEWKLPSYSYERMLARNCIFCSAVYKRSDFDRVGGYNRNMIYGYEDWDFWLSILGKDDEVFKINDVQFYYRIRSRSMARVLDIEKIRFLRRRLWENHKEQYARYHCDITETFEYCLVANSYEYKLGKLLLKPFRFFFRLI